MLGSSNHPEIFCKKVVLKNVVNSLGNICVRVFLRKLQDSANFSKFSGVNYFVFFFRKGNIFLIATTLNQKQGRVHPSPEVLFKKMTLLFIF